MILSFRYSLWKYEAVKSGKMENLNEPQPISNYKWEKSIWITTTMNL